MCRMFLEVKKSRNKLLNADKKKESVKPVQLRISQNNTGKKDKG